jgi:hypothetical protein
MIGQLKNKEPINRIGWSINHIISLKICKERSDWIILPKLTNQNNFIIRTLKWIVNKRYFLYSAHNGFSMCTHVGFFQLYVHDFYSTWNTYYSTWMGMLKSRPWYISAQKSRHFLMHWMSVKLPDNFQTYEHSWPCPFHIKNVENEREMLG